MTALHKGIDASLYKVADVVQVPITYDGHVASGSRTGAFNLLPTLDVEMTVKVMKIFHGAQVGVLFHVLGDLYIVVAHYDKSGVTSAYLVDGAVVLKSTGRSVEDCIAKHMILRGVVDTIRKGVVKAFYWKDTVWKPLSLPTDSLV